MKSVRITLGEPHLRALIRGGIVKVETEDVEVQMILSDIGFDLAQKILDDSKSRKDRWVGYEDKQF